MENRKEVPSCPTIKLKLEKTDVLALIDSGSELSCISEEFYDKLVGMGVPIVSLPVVGITVLGATSKRSKKVHQQVFVDVTIGRIRTKAICLVVVNLVRELILGIDWLVENCVNINFKNKEIKINDQKVDSTLVKMCKITEEEDRGLTTVCHLTQGEMPECRELPRSTNHSQQAKTSITDIVGGLDLEVAEKEALRNILFKHKEVFKDVPGRIKGFECKLQVKNDEGYFEKNYPIPYAHKAAVDEQINKMLECGVIERSTSRYINPMVVVVKKEGSVRLCLDARHLNRRLVPEYESPCPPQELLQGFGEFKWLTNLDLVASYWQVSLAKESRPLTSFKHRECVFSFTVVPFGLNVSVAAFVRALNHVLGYDLEEFCRFYVDDLLIFSRTFEEHLKHVSIVLDRLEQGGATVNLSKSRFCQSSVPFLGHVLSNQGLSPDPRKIEQIHNWPAPKNQRQLKAFLGLCSFYRIYSGAYAQATVPLQELLHKGAKWIWSTEQENAFEEVKKLFVESVQLKFPRYDKPFYLRCDASERGIGAYLYQLDENGDEKVICMGSRVIRGSEVHYTISEKELLSVIWSLMKFRIFILGTELTIITDHKALTFLMKSRLLSGRLSRWVLLIQQFRFKIVHGPGRLNTVADILSRFPLRSDGEIEEIQKTSDVLIAPLIQSVTPELKKKLKNVSVYQRQDDRFGKIIQEIEGGNLDITDKFQIHNQKLFYRKEVKASWKLCLPKVIAGEIIESVHIELGHFGAQKCIAAIQEYFYCKHMSRLIRRIVGACDRCQRTKHPTRIEHGTYTPIIPTGIGQLVSTDIFGPLPKGQRGCRYILVFMDVFSKLVTLYPIVRQTAMAVTNKVKVYLDTVQVPKCMLSDHGTQYTSNEWNQALEERGVRAYLSSIRHPASNPVERVMREIGRILRTYCSQKHSSWVKWVGQVEDLLNSVQHEGTGYTPFELHFNRMCKPKVASLFEPPLSEMPEVPHNVKIMLAEEKLLSKAEKRKLRHEKKFPKKTVFQIGDKVLLKSLHVSNLAVKECKKFFDIFEGPYEVAALAGNNAYELLTDRGKSKGVFNIVNLKPYKSL